MVMNRTIACSKALSYRRESRRRREGMQEYQTVSRYSMGRALVDF